MQSMNCKINNLASAKEGLQQISLAKYHRGATLQPSEVLKDFVTVCCAECLCVVGVIVDIRNEKKDFLTNSSSSDANESNRPIVYGKLIVFISRNFIIFY